MEKPLWWIGLGVPREIRLRGDLAAGQPGFGEGNAGLVATGTARRKEVTTMRSCNARPKPSPPGAVHH